MLARLATLAIAGVVIGVPIPAASQQPGDAIPREVVAAILRNHEGSDDVRIRLESRLPADLEARLALPPGARLLAILDGLTTEIIGTAPGNADAVREWFADDFERRGYLPIDVMGGRAPGFRPAERSVSAGGYCHAGQHFTVSAVNRSPALVEFVVRLARAPGCSQMSDVHASTIGYGYTSSSGPAGPALPLLFHPRSAEISLRCNVNLYGGWSGGDASAQSIISTAVSAASLMAHYGTQLDSAGWSPDRNFRGAIASWTRTDSTGREIRLVLSIQSSMSRPDCTSVRMTAAEAAP